MQRDIASRLRAATLSVTRSSRIRSERSTARRRLTMPTAMPAPAVLDDSGAFSRAALDARLAAERHALRGSGAAAALLVLELDGYADLGPLRAAAAAGLAERLRERHRCWPYRVSECAFVVLLPGGDEAAGAELAEIARASVAIRPVAGRPLTVSVGVAASPAGWGWDDAGLGARADAALRRAQEAGGNAAVAHERGLVTPDAERHQRGRRLAAPRPDVVHPRVTWWSALTHRDRDERPTPALPAAVAPEPSLAAAAHAVVDDPSQALTPDALRWRAAELAERARQNGLPAVLVVTDVDGFAGLAARFGGRAADDVLHQVAHRVETAAAACPYRTGDGTFAVLLVGDDAGRAFGVAERVRARVAAASAGALNLSASVGVAYAAPGRFDLAGVERRAAAALAAAQAGGGDRVRVDGVPAVAPPAPDAPRVLRVA